MRDLFDEIFANQPLDPDRSGAPRHAAAIAPALLPAGRGGGRRGRASASLLDGRPVKTPARRPLAAPTRALAEAIAAEWEAQRDVIDPAKMPLTRLANSIIDGVADAPAAVAADAGKYLASDLVCYRAEAPEGLVARQAGAWDPVLAWARDTLGARFVLAQGMTYVAQPEAALAAARAAHPARSLAARRLPRRHDLDRLGADRARSAAWPPHRRGGLAGGARRRGLEHGFLGPRRACARAPRATLGRDAGGLRGLRGDGRSATDS